jgi:hypothetical protein
MKTEKITSDVLRSAMQEFLSGKAEKKGRMTYKQLQAKSPSKLDNIEVNDSNIGDFLNTARKYDIDFALKRDSTAKPPTYHVFFSANKTEDIKRAFTEYADRKQSEIAPKEEYYSREELRKQAQKKRSDPSKQKHKERTRKREEMR